MKNAKPKVVAPRKRLMAHISEAAQKRLVYIHAPAGFGKTVSAHLWLERTGASYAWLAFDAYDNNIIAFCRRFVSALTRLQPDNAALCEIVAHLHFDISPAEFAVLAASAFENNGRESVLVLDDLHNIESETILSLLPALIRRLDNFTFLFLSRKVPPESFSEFVVKEQLVLVDVESLKFSSDEIKAFFINSGRNLTNEEADEILDATDGWAIGLNALLLSGVVKAEQKLVEEYLETFIRTQIWGRWDEETRSFLLRISVVDELTGPLCEALTGWAESEALLRSLVHENAFLQDTGNAYRFHDLFRAFLDKQLANKAPGLENELYLKAADWYIGQEEYYRAACYYKKGKDYGGVAKSLDLAHNYSTKSANLADKVVIMEKLELAKIPTDILEMHPIILAYLAFAYFVDGKAAEMRRYIDQIIQFLPKIANQPEFPDVLIFILALDQRINLIEIMKNMTGWQHVQRSVAKATTLTENFPFYHRSGRDYSEILYVTEDDRAPIRATFGLLMGDVIDVVEDCIQAGLFYEQGNMGEAYRLALSANAKLREEYSAEMKFCAQMILSAVLTAVGQIEDAGKSLDAATKMIEREKAFYLSANLSAYQYRLRLWNGDVAAAKEWLTDHMPDEHLALYKIYQHFTTARAYIAAGDYHAAVLFIQRLLKLSEDYARPLDILEARVLLAIALWKTGSQADAFEIMEQAVVLAHGYSYTQIFANEGAELVTMLSKLQNRFKHPDYALGIPFAFMRNLYMQALRQSQISKGLTGGVEPATIKFTKKQKSLMKLLCEGYSYKKIAELLGIGHTTVKSNVELLYSKLDVPGAVEAVIKIKALGLLKE